MTTLFIVMVATLLGLGAIVAAQTLWEARRGKQSDLLEVWCAWHDGFMYFKQGGPGRTHGICEPCAEVAFNRHKVR